MSGAAHDYVRACTHPKVKGGTRDLFDAIAYFVPDGETTTRSVGMEALATQARLHRRTVVKRLADLVEIGEVRVIDGGLGRIARYTIVHLDGAPPIVAQPLPLRADLQPVERRSARTDDRTGDLFDSVDAVRSNTEEPVIEPVLIDHRLPGNLWRSITGWVAYLWRSITGWRSDGEKPVLIDHRLTSNGDEPVIATCDPDAVLNTARDVHTFKNIHTPAAPRDGPEEKEKRPDEPAPPPRRPVHPQHAWCGPVVCVPRQLHDEWRRKGHEAAWLFAFYARRSAAIPAGAKITANDFTFWRTALREELADGTPHARPPGPHARRATFGAGNVACPHDPMCPTIGACTERILRETREDRERQTG